MSEIKVVPCPLATHVNRFQILELIDDDSWEVVWPPEDYECCGTEAEALEKAAELRKESDGRQEQVVKASRHPAHESLQAEKGVATASAETAGEACTSRNYNQNSNESVVAKLQEQFQCFDKGCSGCQHDARLIASAIAAARPIETRPPAPTRCQYWRFDGEKQCPMLAKSGTQLCEAHTSIATEPAEQAAPPRPLRQWQIDKLAKDCERLVEDCDIEARFAKTLSDFIKGYDFANGHYAEPAAPAAIEQARPQPCPQCENPKDRQLHNPECYAAAAEPAPERTPPQFVVDEEEAKGTWRRVGVFLTGENFTLHSNSNRVRIALAVPEPAAQQEWPKFVLAGAGESEWVCSDGTIFTHSNNGKLKAEKHEAKEE